MKTTHALFASMALSLLACSSSPSATPLQEGQGGGGASAGAAGRAGAPLDAQGLCDAACRRLVNCDKESKYSYTVDVPVCVAQCVKEVTGEGELIQEIGEEFYTGMRDAPDGCSYPVDGPSAYWLRFQKDSQETSKLKDPQELNECIDALWTCYQDDKDDYRSGCFMGQYRYNHKWRVKKKKCFEKVCPDRAVCWRNIGPTGTVWQAGIELNSTTE